MFFCIETDFDCTIVVIFFKWFSSYALRAVNKNSCSYSQLQIRVITYRSHDQVAPCQKVQNLSMLNVAPLMAAWQFDGRLCRWVSIPRRKSVSGERTHAVAQFVTLLVCMPRGGGAIPALGACRKE